MPANQEEPDGFLQAALRWRGSATPRILPGLILELQYPFNEKSLSHLPLHAICDTIKDNGLALLVPQSVVTELSQESFRSN